MANTGPQPGAQSAALERVARKHLRADSIIIESAVEVEAMQAKFDNEYLMFTLTSRLTKATIIRLHKLMEKFRHPNSLERRSMSYYRYNKLKKAKRADLLGIQPKEPDADGRRAGGYLISGLTPSGQEVACVDPKAPYSALLRQELRPGGIELGWQRTTSKIAVRFHADAGLGVGLVPLAAPGAVASEVDFVLPEAQWSQLYTSSMSAPAAMDYLAGSWVGNGGAVRKIETYDDSSFPMADWWADPDGGAGAWYEVRLTEGGQLEFDKLLQQCADDCVVFNNVPTANSADAAPWTKRLKLSGEELVNGHQVGGGGG